MTLRIGIVLQTPEDVHSAVFIGYQGLSSELARLGHAVAIVTPGTFPSMRRLGGRWTPLTYPAVVAWWTRRQRPAFDLYVFHSYAGWMAQTMELTGGAATVVAFHGVEPLYHQQLSAETARRGGRLSARYRLLQEYVMPRLLRAACRRADLVTCLNSRERTFLAAAGWASPGRVVPLSHGVPPVFFAPPREVRAIERLLFVGQWLPMKGVADLRDAFVALARLYPSLTLTCAGTLADTGSVLADFPVDLRPQVRVVPRIDRDELARLYRDSDAFVFPSLYEGFSRAIVEAMASGLPIVTTQVGVAIDALEDGASAMIVPPARPDALVSAIDALVRDPALAASVGGNARAAADRYHEDRTTRDAAAVLVALAARRGQAGTGKAV